MGEMIHKLGGNRGAYLNPSKALCFNSEREERNNFWKRAE